MCTSYKNIDIVSIMYVLWEVWLKTLSSLRSTWDDNYWNLKEEHLKSIISSKLVLQHWGNLAIDGGTQVVVLYSKWLLQYHKLAALIRLVCQQISWQCIAPILVKRLLYNIHIICETKLFDTTQKYKLNMTDNIIIHHRLCYPAHFINFCSH